MTFRQEPPRLGNQYETDRALRSYLKRALPPEVLSEIEPELTELGELAGGELYRMQLEDRPNEPRLTQWDAWGERVDRVEVSPLWHVSRRRMNVSTARTRASTSSRSRTSSRPRPTSTVALSR
jgi:hypothetical protein